MKKHYTAPSVSIVRLRTDDVLALSLPHPTEEYELPPKFTRRSMSQDLDTNGELIE